MCNLAMVNAIALPFHGIAFVVTCFRLYRQWRKRQLWWDDYFAAVAFVGDVVFTLARSINLSNFDRVVLMSFVMIFSYALDICD